MGMSAEVNYGEYAETPTPSVETPAKEQKCDIEVVKTRSYNILEDKDKLILIFYLNVNNVNKTDTCQYLSEADEFFHRWFDDTVKVLLIPIRDGETHVEVINPKLISQEEWDNKYSKVIEKAEKLIEEFKKEKE